MASSKSSGTQTCTLGTWHTLATITDAGTYQIYVDVNALANGETLEYEIEYKVTSGGTTRDMLKGVIAKHAQAEPVKALPPVASINEVIFKIQQSGGTGRSIPWEVVQLDG